MGAAVRERRLLEHDLRNAIPVANCGSSTSPRNASTPAASSGSRPCCAGSIPTRGDISPGEFIPLAEETGMHSPDRRMGVAHSLPRGGKWSEPLTIAVNVSAVQIHSANFAPSVHEILFETGLPAGRLELEITETALVRDLNRALATLRRIKTLGVRIAMDDFGTGYSSLSNLRAFPFDKIKIDGSFIKSVNVNDQGAAIVRSVLGLGRALKLVVLAEGVETSASSTFSRPKLQRGAGLPARRPADIETSRR